MLAFKHPLPFIPKTYEIQNGYQIRKSQVAGCALFSLLGIFRLTQDYAGQYLEKPWVLLTSRGDEDKQLASTEAENTTAEPNQLLSTQAEDGTGKSNQLATTQAEKITQETKWNAVNASLLQYADQVGKDDTFLGKYLTSLASLSPPAEIGTSGNEDMPLRSRPYGIFDVVVTAGKGSKYAPSQGGSLEEPTPLMLAKITPLTPAQVLAAQYARDLSSLSAPSISVTPVASRAPRQPCKFYVSSICNPLKGYRKPGVPETYPL